MSNFLCEHCGIECIDSPAGYVTGCDHYPPDKPAPRRSMADQLVEMANSAPDWLSKSCQIYTGKCSCPDGEPRCRP